MRVGLEAGAPWPEIDAEPVGDGPSVGEIIAGRWSIVLCYRGDW